MRQFALFLSILLLNISFHGHADDQRQKPNTTVSLIADEWCPYSCADTAENRGLIVDVAAAAFKEVGLQVSYKTTSWARAIREVEKANSDALLGADAIRMEHLYLTEDFVIHEETAFAVLKDSTVVINSNQDLLKYKIAHMLGYNYGDNDYWNSIIKSHPNAIKLSATYGEVRMIDLLVKKRIDLAVVNIDVAKQYLQKNPDIQNIRFIRKDITADLHVGFSPTSRGQYLYGKFIEGYKRLKHTPALAAIYKKYNIEMPAH